MWAVGRQWKQIGSSRRKLVTECVPLRGVFSPPVHQWSCFALSHISCHDTLPQHKNGNKQPQIGNSDRNAAKVFFPLHLFLGHLVTEVCVYTWIYVSLLLFRYLQRPESAGSPRSGLTGGCEHLVWVSGAEPRSLEASLQHLIQEF